MRRAMAAVLAVTLATFLDLGLTARAEPADEQRAVLITGASSGIGRMAAERLARAGYFVYAGARKQSDIEALDAIDNVKAVRLDVTSQEDIDAAVELIGLLHLNHGHPYSYSREHLIKMMDSESAIVRGEKPRGMPGEI